MEGLSKLNALGPIKQAIFVAMMYHWIACRERSQIYKKVALFNFIRQSQKSTGSWIKRLLRVCMPEIPPNPAITSGHSSRSRF